MERIVMPRRWPLMQHSGQAVGGGRTRRQECFLLNFCLSCKIDCGGEVGSEGDRGAARQGRAL